MRGIVFNTCDGTWQDVDAPWYVAPLLVLSDGDAVVELLVRSSLGFWSHVVAVPTGRAGIFEVTPQQIDAIAALPEPDRTNLWAKIAARHVSP